MEKRQLNRRNLIKGLGLGVIGGGLGITGIPAKAEEVQNSYRQATKGLSPLKITNVKAIATCPHDIELIVVKVETNEPGLYGLGCATFRQRAHAVVAAIDKYLNGVGNLPSPL